MKQLNDQRREHLWRQWKGLGHVCRSLERAMVAEIILKLRRRHWKTNTYDVLQNHSSWTNHIEYQHISRTIQIYPRTTEINTSIAIDDIFSLFCILWLLQLPHSWWNIRRFHQTFWTPSSSDHWIRRRYDFGSRIPQPLRQMRRCSQLRAHIWLQSHNLKIKKKHEPSVLGWMISAAFHIPFTSVKIHGRPSLRPVSLVTGLSGLMGYSQHGARFWACFWLLSVLAQTYSPLYHATYSK